METRLGVDIGGTFTDLVTIADGSVRVEKVASTPDAPERAVANGLETIADAAPPADIGFFAHGTTVATNAVLEGEFAETALVTNEGFRDALEIGRQNRPDIYDLHGTKPDSVVPRHRRYGIPGRLDARGEELEALDEDAVRELAADIDADSVAVSLLFAFENSTHEERVADILREAGVESVSLSSTVLPEIREYERTLATSLNAALRPVMDRYLGRLESELDDLGVTAPLRVMGSSGGIVDGETARTRPVETLLSGPAAGVRGAAHVAGRLGHENLLTMDMGGTSCDVSLVEGGDPVVTRDVEVGPYPVAVPMVDVHTVGSGGGSLAWLDEGGALRVGPNSAGADPGPVCYGRGGTDPTVTDAHCVLGRIDPGAFLGDVGGAVAAADSAFERLGDRLGVGRREAAAGVIEVANANLARALRVVSVERGYDPREFALVAFGGAGPLHATAVAADVGVPEVLVPRAAGVLSALGLLVSDLTYDDSATRIRPWDDLDAETLESTLREFERVGTERVPDGLPVEHERYLDVRYVGQSFDLRVPAPDDIDAAALDTVAARFHERHEARYGHAARGEPLELVTVRVRTRGVVDPPDIDPPTDAGTADDAVRETRTVRFDGDRETPVYDRGELPTETELEGPAIVEGAESTVAVRPADSLTVERDGTLRLEVGR
ncbi:hydantoinase/oxoprolinase family protein [Natronomonas gomsonensis]|uniref:hydantoinase/oxoprolinase family protein n=1 Tax=Natronomonas gomsonensis TaxID=1046043 RepID=UPI0020CA6EE9|nr:hydantoinase/oxoprolinase family protein [Natronomonas gomsonensis]MCY4729405.1 hydantoinase/oxoprolinase family protein [Natronomonas gomsonensis]